MHLVLQLIPISLFIVTDNETLANVLYIPTSQILNNKLRVRT